MASSFQHIDLTKNVLSTRSSTFSDKHATELTVIPSIVTVKTLLENTVTLTNF